MLRIYDEYKKYGVDKYYKEFSNKYVNPHEEKIEQIYVKYIKNIINTNDKILDLACGEGLISKLINKYNNNCNCIVKGTDPYFKNKYCHYNYSFQDIALGTLNNKFDIVICCYAYHLLENSWQYSFLNSLAEITGIFIILSPSKKIKIKHPKWKLIEEYREDKITILILQTI